MSYIDVCISKHEGYIYIPHLSFLSLGGPKTIVFEHHLKNSDELSDELTLSKVSSHNVLRNILRKLSQDQGYQNFRIELEPDASIDILYHGDTYDEVTVTVMIEDLAIYASK